MRRSREAIAALQAEISRLQGVICAVCMERDMAEAWCKDLEAQRNEARDIADFFGSLPSDQRLPAYEAWSARSWCSEVPS